MFLHLQLMLLAISILRGVSTRDPDKESDSIAPPSSPADEDALEVSRPPESESSNPETSEFSLFATPGEQKEAELLTGGGGNSTSEARERLKQWLQASDASDCGVTNLAGRLMPGMEDTGATSAKQIEWDDVTSGIDWSSIKADYNANSEAIDRSLQDDERKLAETKTRLEQTPSPASLDAEKVTALLTEHLESQYCEASYDHSKNKKKLADLYSKLEALAQSEGNKLIEPKVVKDAFAKNFPLSLQRRREPEEGQTRGKMSPCFELRIDLSENLGKSDMAAKTDGRKRLEDEMEALTQSIEYNKKMKLTCAARMVDLNDFQQMLGDLKRQREEKMATMEDTSTLIDRMTEFAGAVTAEEESLKQHLRRVEGEYANNKQKKAKISKALKDISAAMEETTSMKEKLSAALLYLKQEAVKATTAVEAADTVKAKVSYFVQVFLETYKQSVRAPIGEGISFKMPLDELNGIADKMIEQPINKVEDMYKSFENTVGLITDLSSYCKNTALPALGQISTVTVTDDNGEEATPSAICKPTSIHEDITRTQLESYINAKRREIGQAIKQLTKLMADDSISEQGDENATFDQRLHQFQVHGGQDNIYEDYLKHWRVLPTASSGKEGTGTAKKGLYLELVLQLRNLKEGLIKTKQLTMDTINAAEKNMKAAQQTFKKTKSNLEKIENTLKENDAEKQGLADTIAILQDVGMAVKNSIKSFEKERDDLFDNLEEIEGLIVKRHGEIKASLLELGLGEHEFEAELQRIREEP